MPRRAPARSAQAVSTREAELAALLACGSVNRRVKVSGTTPRVLGVRRRPAPVESVAWRQPRGEVERPC